MSGITPARVVKNGQYEPRTTTSPKDCVAAEVAMQVETATAGRIRPTHADIRKWVLTHGGGRDDKGNVRGLTLTEGAQAAKALYGVTLVVLTGQTRTQVRDTVGNGRTAGISIDARVTVNTARATNDYGADKTKMAGHLIFVRQYREWPGGSRCECELRATYKHGEFLVEDPGTTTAGYLWWSASLVYRAAEARTGNKGIQLLVGPDTESVAWKCIAGTRVRSEPSFQAGETMTTLIAGADPHRGGRTENGGPWARPNGTQATQWIHIQLASGKWGWVRGGAMQLAAA